MYELADALQRNQLRTNGIRVTTFPSVPNGFSEITDIRGSGQLDASERLRPATSDA